jgi:uncharacterized protein with PQ loop repeat
VEEVVVDETTPLLRSTSTTLAMCFLGWMQTTQPTSSFHITSNLEEEYTYTIGRIVSWICTCLYLSSRIPQILLNFKRRSCHGLAIAMFMCALFGNITYATSILVKSLDPEYLMRALPFLLGTAGTVVFDIIIFLQWVMYPSYQIVIDLDQNS